MENFTKLEMIETSVKAQAIYDAHKSCMTVKECADFLNVHHNTVKNKLHSGEFKGTLIGRVWSIPKIQFLDKIIKDWEK